MHETADSPPGHAACAADFACLQRLLQMLDGYCALHAVPAEARHDLHLIVEEACVNIIHYAYPAGAPGPIRLQVQARVRDARPLVEVVIEDEGVAFDLFSLPEPDRGRPLEELPAGGFGVTLIRRLSDRLHHARHPDGGNVLTVTKFLPASAAT
ncbi:ATP-binding protein [Pseudorhodoferax sp.]|uniref:ATP-binding protein n=1 Tax=Pseudorhodoferax sp. TaxID=1993553 RepID=UPI002DD64367|nr:ATP-binding protein [Pseudorhodoferax sp.]